MTNSFLPSLPGRGSDKDIGLEVNGTGLSSERRKPALLWSAQISLWDTKRKYFPSSVHLPQHSLGGLCQPSSSRCSFVPSAATSHSSRWPRVPAVSEESNRKPPPSGDQERFLISPFTESSLWESVPSAFPKNKSPRLV